MSLLSEMASAKPRPWVHAVCIGVAISDGVRGVRRIALEEAKGQYISGPIEVAGGSIAGGFVSIDENGLGPADVLIEEARDVIGKGVSSGIDLAGKVRGGGEDE